MQPKRKAIRIILGLATVCCLLFGGLFTLHAVTPHKCARHGQSVSCEHVKDSADLHGPGQPSENMKKKQKQNGDWMDIAGCGCFWDCLLSGSF